MDRTLLDSDIGPQASDFRLKSLYSPKSIVHSLLSVVRYRFLLFAGIFPYTLGAAVGFHSTGTFHPLYFWVGFAGIALTLVGVEVLNEHFDYKIGGDRVFLNSERKVPQHYLRTGIVTFALASFIALYLALLRGWPIILFAMFGALSAIFYVAPPVQWSYRGLGELMIFLAYGPFMTLGSYYLQTQRIDFDPIVVSLVPGFLIFALALINEVPDYYGDRLVGKRNIVVRMGRRKTVALYAVILSASFAVVGTGLALREFPIPALLIFLALPLAYRNALIAKRHYEYPKLFIPVIRGTICLYTVVISLFTISYFLNLAGWSVR